jgi:hypothetical protein
MTLSTSKNLTILGILTIIGALTQAAVAFFDGDAATSVNIEATFTAIMAGVGMILAKGAQNTGGSIQTPPAP